MFDSYEDALNNRRNWVNPSEFGEVTYVGNYCVITGTRVFSDEESVDGYGDIPGDTRFVGVMYYVGHGSAMKFREMVGKYDSVDEFTAKQNHNRLVNQAEQMDLLEFVYEP